MLPQPALHGVRSSGCDTIPGFNGDKTPSMTDTYLFTSESVSEGHPDKVADQISDAILDAILKEDKSARVAVETMVKTGMAIIAGEVTTTAWVDLEEVVRGTIIGIVALHLLRKVKIWQPEST